MYSSICMYTNCFIEFFYLHRSEAHSTQVALFGYMYNHTTITLPVCLPFSLSLSLLCTTDPDYLPECSGSIHNTT